VRLCSIVYGVATVRPLSYWFFVGKYLEQLVSTVNNQLVCKVLLRLNYGGDLIVCILIGISITVFRWTFAIYEHRRWIPELC